MDVVTDQVRRDASTSGGTRLESHRAGDHQGPGRGVETPLATVRGQQATDGRIGTGSAIPAPTTTGLLGMRK